jgi:hypothetical protein
VVAVDFGHKKRGDRDGRPFCILSNLLASQLNEFFHGAPPDDLITKLVLQHLVINSLPQKVLFYLTSPLCQ